jgi:gas vesicle protein
MSRRARERTVIIERGGSSLWWFLVGGALGAGLALLFAPQSGDRTRRVVGRKLGKLKDAAEETLDELREAWSPEEEGVHRSLAQTEDDADEEEDAGSEDEGEAAESNSSGNSRPAVTARQELERRLAEARARRQRALATEDEEPVA